MKLLIRPLLLLAGVGAGCQGIVPGAAHRVDCDPAACDPEGCRVSVECTDHGTCIVTCTEPNGEVRCQEEIPCDAPCVGSGGEGSAECKGVSSGKACVLDPACRR